jgi:hypothetical protein
MVISRMLCPRALRGFVTHLITLCASAWLFAAPAQAGELALLVNGKAIHLDKQEGVTYNERNWGAGLQYDFDPVADGKWVPFVSASGFIDSMENPSYYAGGGALRRFQLGKAESNTHFDLGAIAFFMTREDFHDGRPFFGILPVASLGTGRVAINMTYIPKVDPKMVPIVFFQLRISIF